MTNTLLPWYLTEDPENPCVYHIQASDLDEDNYVACVEGATPEQARANAQLILDQVNKGIEVNPNANKYYTQFADLAENKQMVTTESQYTVGYGLSYIVLVSVYILNGEGYGVTIKEQIEILRQKDVTAGAVYNTLLFLQSRNLIESSIGDITSKRGGKRKTYYKITQKGIDALKESLREQERVMSHLKAGGLQW